MTHTDHGWRHVPKAQGGTDPIPGLDGLSTVQASTPFSGTIMSFTSLTAYWRMGEASPGPFADTSGVGTAADATRSATGGTPPTYQVPGCLAQDDDGAWEQNAVTTVGTNSDSDWFVTAAAAKHEYESGGGGSQSHSMCAWIKPKASANTFEGGILGNVTSVTGSPNKEGGWQLFMQWPTRVLVWQRGTNSLGVKQAVSPAGLAADTCHFVAGTYDRTSGDLSLYINGTLVDTESSNENAYSLGSILRIGLAAVRNFWSGIGPNNSYAGAFYGTLDEIATFSDALTLAEIQQLYAAGIATGFVEEGYVPVPDGTGGSTWAAPTIEVDY